MELFSLLGTISVNNEEANKNIDETSEKAGSFGQKLANGIGTVGKWGTAIVGSATAATTALVAFAGSSASTADHIDKMSQKIGISRQAYQELDFICSQSGTSVDGLQASMKTLTNSLADAQAAVDQYDQEMEALDEALENGKISAKEYDEQYDKISENAYKNAGALKELGFTLYDIQNMSPEDALFGVIQKLQQMPDDANRAALAQKLLGRNAQELAPLLNAGSGSIEEMKEQAHELGLVLSDELIDDGVNLTDSLDQTKRAFGAIITQLGASLMPIVEQASDYIQQALPYIQDLVQKLAPVITSLLSSMLPPLMNLAQQIFPALFSMIEQVIPFISQLMEKLLPVIVELLNTLLPPLMQIVQMLLPLLMDILNAIMPLLDALMPLLQPILDLLIVILEPLIQLLDMILPPLIAVITAMIDTLVEYLTPAINMIADILNNVFGAAFEALTPVIESVKTVMNDVFNAIQTNVMPIVETIAEGIISGFTTMKETVEPIFEALAEVVDTIFNGIWDSIKFIVNGILSCIEGMANGVIAGVNLVIKALNNLSFEIPDWVPGFGGKKFGFDIGELSEVTLPRLEKGGVLEKGQTGFLEGNGAEAVVPLENNQKWIRAVADDMQAQGLGGNAETLEALKQILILLQDIPDALIDAIANMKFDINNREFARMVKAVN